ncbi:hypothetical protein EFW57_03410 [Bacillus velezensis]|nr:hypothetical protein EFW57_03410 [Bacillus velezensis]
MPMIRFCSLFSVYDGANPAGNQKKAIHLLNGFFSIFLS